MTSEYDRILAQIVGGGMDVFHEFDVRCMVYLLNILVGGYQSFVSGGNIYIMHSLEPKVLALNYRMQ